MIKCNRERKNNVYDAKLKLFSQALKNEQKKVKCFQSNCNTVQPFAWRKFVKWSQFLGYILYLVCMHFWLKTTCFFFIFDLIFVQKKKLSFFFHSIFTVIIPKSFEIVIAINQSSVWKSHGILFPLYNIFQTLEFCDGNECNGSYKCVAYKKRGKEWKKKIINKIRWIDGVMFCSVHWHWYDWENSNRSEWLALNTRALAHHVLFTFYFSFARSLYSSFSHSLSNLLCICGWIATAKLNEYKKKCDYRIKL